MRIFGVCKDLKAFWHFFCRVAVAHPAVDALTETLEQIGLVVYDKTCSPVFSAVRSLYPASKIINQYLMAVANSKNWLAHLEEIPIRFWRALCIDARRSP